MKMRKTLSTILCLMMVAAVFAVGLLINVCATAPTYVWVDDDFDEDTPGWGVDHFDKIQDGVNAVEISGTVYVHIGTYYENIVIDTALKLIGEDGETTIIQGTGSGIGIYNRASGVAIENLNIKQFYTGIWLYFSNSNTVSGNKVSSEILGIFVYCSTSNTINDNTISGATYGIELERSSDSTLTNNVMTDGGIFIEGNFIAHWNSHTIDTTNTINGKPVYYWKSINGGSVPSGPGQVILADCTNVVVENQDVSDDPVGILIGFSSDITIQNNIVSNSKYGISLYYSSDNTISGNIISGNDFGIYLYQSNSSTICENMFSNNGEAFETLRSNYNVIRDNTFIDNYQGIKIGADSTNNTVSGNYISDGHNGIGFSGWYNTINGNTVIMCTGTSIGFHGSYNTITGNTIETSWGSGVYPTGIIVNGWLGYDLGYSCISGNHISGAWYGIRMQYTYGNTFCGNNVSNSCYGIWFHTNADNNNIVGNTLWKNYYGFRFYNSNNNNIFHNNLIDNTAGIYQYLQSINTWDNGEGEGNYWSNYKGEDLDGDGVGDTLLPHQTVDWFPLMNPWEPDPFMEIQRLKDYIEGLDIPLGTKNSLIKQLEAAENALANDKPETAINILNGFIHHVEGLANGGKLTQEQAEYMIFSAMRAIIIIEQGGPSPCC